MNRIKRYCALLLAIVLLLGVALQPKIGEVYAESAEQTEQSTQSTSEPTTEPTIEPTIEPTAEPTTEPTIEPTTEPTIEPTTEPTTEPMTELATQPTPEPVSEPAAEPAGFPWEGMDDQAFAAWLMDSANAEAVKPFLVGGSEKYAALTARIGEISDTVLKQQVSDHLDALRKDEYIYFDLAAGSVTIGKNTYSGFVFVKGAPQPVSGTHADGNKYYVYQSTDTNKAQTGYAETQDYNNHAGCRVPVYNRVSYEGKLWTDYITNNIEVKTVSTNWDTAAKDSGRTETGNNITFTPASNYTANVTIDNIWSTYWDSKRENRTTGGIGADLQKNTNTTINLLLKGDSRVGCVHYSSEEGNQYNNQIRFLDGEKEGTTPGSITVADFKDRWNGNHWCTAIGSNDYGLDRSNGIVIDGGVIYAGTTPEDNCTAIGGGGNAYGKVTINGGIVTAVVSSTGTAIGGGIGFSGAGGNTDIFINGGTIYAYNLGIVRGANSQDNFTKFVPAAAIGGGGSNGSSGNTRTNITITDGTIYAQSMGGAAIGGGCSASKNGGPANITISGGTIIAKSIGGTYGGTQTVDPGVSIGGGTGATGGGSVILNISGESTILRTGSIGGGKTTGSGTIGSATVTIEDGDIVGQVIMAGTGDPQKKCSFTMTDGRLHSTNLIDGNTITDITDPQEDVPIRYLEKNGGAVWMADPIGVTNISGGTIEGCTAYRGGAVYMEGGTFTLSGSGTIQNNTARIESTDVGTTGRGGAVYVTGGTANINGGSIKTNNAQVRGGGLYVTSDAKTTGTVKVTGGSIQGNTAGFDAAGNSIRADVGRGGGVYLEGGLFTMTGGEISQNRANYRGGGIFLTKKPTLTAGTISGNTAKDSGGGLCLNGDQLELTSANMQIFGNEAANGGGVAVLNGDFILRGGAVGVKDRAPNFAQRGGGVYVANDTSTATGTIVSANATVESGNIWYNKATEGGGVYLAEGEGSFTLEGENAIISQNTATRGGGVYLYKDPALNQGRIEANTADENGGGMYISDCLVTLNPTNAVIITGNHAVNGGGIYIHGSSSSSKNSGMAVDAVTAATPTQRVGLLVAPGFTGTVSFTNNTATVSGGAVCIDVGRFYLESDRITITGNEAINGGGVAVLHGNFTMSTGSIGEENGKNTATYGGGVYVSSGEVWLKGGSVKYNEATDGGGAYVTGGKMIMLDGALEHNSATGNGGGAYVAGDFRMQGGTIGGSGNGNHATNGGGVYVSEGNVTVVYGDISHNHAERDGGGFLVSSSGSAVKVEMLSGSLSNNQAGANGGGMAVESANNTTITVEIGCLLNHNLSEGKPTYPVQYEEAYASYAHFDDKDYAHNSCPQVKNNQAGSVGGGFYMNSYASTLSFFCVEETANIAQDEDSGGMDVLGGNVIIGDKGYHNHKYNEEHNIRPNNAPWGYVSMDDATLVNGGQVDIYGDLTNPTFNKEIVVDIINQDDHFMDHRRAVGSEKIYKVHYFENFQGTGRFESRDYHEGDTVITVKGAIFSHPGYELLGWYTKPVYNPTEHDPNNTFYEVGKSFDLSDREQVPQMGQHGTDCQHCGEDHKDTNLLGLYAIWEANGYTVVFDPNVPLGDTYTGTMDDQIHQYGLKQALTPNSYQYSGHIFAGWNRMADGSGTQYGDGEEVSNLTNKNGDKVLLYAQWTPCDHSDPNRWSYSVESEKTLVRDCSCGGQTLTATLSAEDTVYDGGSHPATLTYSDETAWGEDKPTVITYEGQWLNDVHLGVDSLLSNSSEIPHHAGKYTASIRKKDAIAFVQYTIEKAEQQAPEKPKYEVTGNQVVINNPSGPNGVGARAQYRLSYYVGANLAETEWETNTDESTTFALTMETAWTSYNVEARYEERNNYKASAVVRADAVYHYAGDVTVKLICDEGIEPYFSAELDSNGKLNGANLILNPRDGYYIVGGRYTVTAELQDKGNTSAPTEHPVEQVVNTDNQYSVKDVPDNSILTITIGTAKKKPQSAARVTPGQKFSTFSGTNSTVISRDSAFTAAFQISNYDPNVYTGLNLTFDDAIPENTTMILLNRKDGTYWYYRANAAVSSVALTDFKRMGGSGNYSIPLPAENGYMDLSYQFIVDFSQSVGYSKDSMTMHLQAPAKADLSNVPVVDSPVTVSMKDPNFSFTLLDNAIALTHSFECTFRVDATASKWENRASALVLKPTGDTALPPDARIQAEVNNGTTYLYKSGDRFIIPLSLLQNGENTQLKLTLLSNLFPLEGSTAYSFTAQWLISPSKAGKAPMVGDMAGELLNVTFTSSEKKAPSLKTEGVDGQSRILTSQDTLKLSVSKLNMDGYTISAALLRKAEDGNYVGTGKSVSLDGDSLSVSLAGQKPGSFCLMLTVKREDDSVTTVMEVPYYFIIKAT